MDQETPQGGAGPEPPVILAPPKSPTPVARLRTYFLTGIIVTAPISITIYLTVQLIEFVDATFTPLIPPIYNPENYLPFSLPGIGVVVALVLLTFIGWVTASFFGRTLVHLGERIVDRMPVVRTIYSALKQIFETVLKNSSGSFRQAVLVEYPRRDAWTVAFVTSETEGEVERLLADDMINIYVPTTPNPTSGFLLFVPKKDLIFLEMSVEEAAKMIISTGVIIPPDRGAQPKLVHSADTPADPARAERIAGE